MVTLLLGARLKAFAAAAAVLALGATLLLSGRSPDVPGFSVPPAYSAAVDYFLKIDGVDGESSADGHRGEIEIQSFSWGVSNGGSHSTGGGGGAGKVSMNDFSFMKRIDKSSPLLMRALFEGRRIPKVVLSARKPGSKQDFLKVTLSDVLVSSFQTTGGGDVPTDSLSLNFTKIEYAYTPTGADGAAQAALIATYDLKAAKK